MKKERLTPRANQKKANRSVSPQNVTLKGKTKDLGGPLRGLGKENECVNSKEQTLQICLDLASYHKREAEELKQKNEKLEEKLKEEVKDIEHLRSQLKKIKAFLNTDHLKRDIEILKTQNSQLKSENIQLKEEISDLKKKVEQLNQENLQLKGKPCHTESLLIESESKCEQSGINTLTLAKQSRRQEYANRYECFSFVPSAACLQCARKENQLEEARTKYSNELRHLQSQIAIEVMEKQMVSKNQCIDYLLVELNCLEKDSVAILQNMSELERKLQDISEENMLLRSGGGRLRGSVSKSVA